jgi:hypothetical protein
MKKGIEDIKGVIMMDRQNHGEIKRTKEQTMIYKTLDRKLKIEQHKHHKISGEGRDPCAQRGQAVPSPIVAPVVLHLLQNS